MLALQVYIVSKKVVLYFGNELIPEDRLAIEIANELKRLVKGYEFYHCLSPEELIRFVDYDKIVLLDVSPNIAKVVKTSNLNLIKKRKLTSLHDFDLNFFLNLLKKLGKTTNIDIIVVPMNSNKNNLVKIIKKFL